MKLYPLRFKPIYKERLWGGNKLRDLLQRKLPDAAIGESWELSCRVDDMSVVENGFLAGRTLGEIMFEYKERLLGKNFLPNAKFPLLIKFIDADDKLSLQVHPGDALAQRLHGECGKTEAWYVVAAAPNARIVYGLKKGVGKVEFARAIAAGEVEKCLHLASVRTGDLVFIPSGLVHGLSEGVMVCEVQQNSDTTYRIYDYERVGADGKRRELHLAQAMEAIDFCQAPSEKFKNDKLQCPYFNMEKLKISDEYRLTTEDECTILCITAGEGELLYEAATEKISAGTTVLLPAELGEIMLCGRLEGVKINWQ